MAGFDFGAPRIRPMGRQFQRVQVDPRVNNGTTTGGLAFALQSALKGYEQGQERKAVKEDEAHHKDAQSALMRGLLGEPAIDAPLPEGISGPVRPEIPGGLDYAAQELAGLEGNPYAGRLATQLAMMQMDQQRDDERYQQQRGDKLADREAEYQMRRELAGYQASLRPAPQAPSAVQEYNFFSALPPEEQQRYLSMKRAQQIIDLGDRTVVSDPLSPGAARGTFYEGIAPERKIQDGRVVTLPGVPGGDAPPGGVGTQMSGADRRAARTGGSQGGYGIQELPPTAAQEAQAAETRRLKDTQAELVNTKIGEARSAITGATLPVTGLMGSIASNIGGTAALDLRETLGTIKANIGFDKLQSMRDASPTGGALGQVSEFENRLLQAVYGSLEQAQSEEQLLRNLDLVENTYSEIVNYGIPPEEAKLRLQQLQGVAPGVSADDDLINKYLSQ